MRLATNVIFKDWYEYRKLILFLTLGAFLPFLILGKSSGFAQGMLIGLLLSAAYGFSQLCFMIERQRGTLQFMLGLPARPFHVVLAKYASLYSIVLVITNAAGIFLNDLRVLFLMNAAVLFFSTICMTSTVISEKPWAGMVPLWAFLVCLMPIRRTLEEYYPPGLDLLYWITDHLTLLAAIGIALVPIIAVAAAFSFQRKFDNAAGTGPIYAA